MVVAAGEVVVEALVPILVPVVGLVQVALLLLVAVGAALLLLLAADGRGAALHLVAAGAESQQYDTHAQLKYQISMH